METRDSQHRDGDDVSYAPQEIKNRLTAQNVETKLESWAMRENYEFAPQHFLYFLPLPQGQGSLRPTFAPERTTC